MPRLIQVAVPVPLFSSFDYLCDSSEPVEPGARVTVPFGRRHLVGVVIGEVENSDVPVSKLRRVSKVHDELPVLLPEVLKLLQWASRYYHSPLGEVMASAMPALLRKGKSASLSEREFYQWVGPEELPVALQKAPLQYRVAQHLASRGGRKVSADSVAALSPRWRQAVNALEAKGFVSCSRAVQIPDNRSIGHAPRLASEQRAAVDSITSSLGMFQTYLLNGVTGSGKTEVYIQCIQAASERKYQSLVIVPEISLTPQLMQRFEERLDGCLVALHSSLNDTQRLQNWLCASQGHADVVIGTRSAVLVPLPRLGLVIIDEEHDSSLKQQEGFRYHARDLALKRAVGLKCPVVLGSATPSFESLNNVHNNRYVELRLTQRAGDSIPPALGLLDIRRRKLVEGMSDRLIDAMKQHLHNSGQVLVFINRRGFSPTLLCNTCGAAAACKRCDANMTVHAKLNRLRCHHCGAERAIPPGCESCQATDLDCVGYGTERIAKAIAEIFPDISIARIDRDSTLRKGELEQQLARAVKGEARILVGTQMLAKGHHFPDLTLVCIMDADRGLFGCDFRSRENMGQQIVQVAGRAGREIHSGAVLIQTRNPDNPMLQTLVHEGYGAFASIAMQDRRLADLPPYSFMALVRAEAVDSSEPMAFLRQVAQFLEQQRQGNLQVLGPAPAPMERMGGRFRIQLLLQSDKRSTLNDSLSKLCKVIDDMPGVRRCRWSIDVDPVDLY